MKLLKLELLLLLMASLEPSNRGSDVFEPSVTPDKAKAFMF
jgi:hypothetical protein